MGSQVFGMQCTLSRWDLCGPCAPVFSSLPCKVRDSSNSNYVDFKLSSTIVLHVQAGWLLLMMLHCCQYSRTLQNSIVLHLSELTILDRMNGDSTASYLSNSTSASMSRSSDQVCLFRSFSGFLGFPWCLRCPIRACHVSNWFHHDLRGLSER